MNKISKALKVCMTAVALAAAAPHSALADNDSYGKNRHHILIINSFNEGAPWSQSFIHPIVMELADRTDLTISIEHMNLTFMTNDSLYTRMTEGLLSRIDHNRPDGIVMIGSASFTLLEAIKDRYGEIPTILLGRLDKVGSPSYNLSGTTNDDTDDTLVPLQDLRDKYDITFIEAPFMYKETIDLMVRMNPDMTTLVFAADHLASNRHMSSNIEKYLATTYPAIKYEWLSADSTNNQRLFKYIFNRDKQRGILFSSWFFTQQDIYGHLHLVAGGYMALPQSNQPIYSLREAYLNNGILGGYYVDHDKIVEKLLKYVNILADGGSMRDQPFYYPEYPEDFNYKINYDLLQRYGYSESDCPEGTVFVNRPKGFWETYRLYIIITLLLAGAVLTIIMLRTKAMHSRIKLLTAYDSLVSNMPIVYTHATAAKGDDGSVKDVKFTRYNSTFENLYKSTADSKDDPFFKSDTLNRLIGQMFKEGQTVQFSHYFKSTDSYYEFILVPSPEPDSLDIFANNATKRTKAENEIREQRKKLEMTLNMAHIIPWRWDLKSQQICCESQGALHHLKIPTLKGSTRGYHIIDSNEFFMHIHKEDLSRIRQSYQELVDANHNYLQEEFRIVTAENGAEKIDWLEVNASINEFDGNRNPTSLVGSLLLITERKKQETALIHAREKATESDRLKSAFLANMSHEIRTPLNAIVGFSNLLASTDDKEKKEKFIGIIENNNQLLLQLISDILDLAKVEADTLEFVYKPTDINELIRSIENTVRMRVKPGVVLNFNLGAAECTVQAERNRLSQVLINLLTNACKFTEHGSITFGYELRGHEIYFYVRDTGIGIAREKQATVFDRFAKLNNFAQGTGLGLSICQSIIKKMNGAIGVDSPGEGLGTTFWFTIPYVPVDKDSSADTQAVAEEKETINGKEKLTLLIAEDNESNYLLFETILSKDYNLIHAWDGVEAVELFKEHKPNIIIMDITMPNMDGYEATREIRKVSTSVPIIAVTAYAFASDKERILENGFNGYVSKPVNANRLKSELKSTIDSSFILL